MAGDQQHDQWVGPCRRGATPSATAGLAAYKIAGLPLPAAFIARRLSVLRAGHDREWSRNADYS